MPISACCWWPEPCATMPSSKKICKTASSAIPPKARWCWRPNRRDGCNAICKPCCRVFANCPLTPSVNACPLFTPCRPLLPERRCTRFWPIAAHQGRAAHLVLTKGAADGLIEVCGRILINGVVQPLNEQRKAAISAENTAMAKNGIRGAGFGLSVVGCRRPGPTGAL